MTEYPVFLYPGRLMVTSDAASRGSQGRVYLDLRGSSLKAPSPLVGRKYRTVGTFHGGARHIVLSSDGSDKATKSVLADGVLWWKNGVAELGLLESHTCVIFELRQDLLLVQLEAVIPRPPDASPLPSVQLTLFDP